MLLRLARVLYAVPIIIIGVGDVILDIDLQQCRCCGSHESGRRRDGTDANGPQESKGRGVLRFDGAKELMRQASGSDRDHVRAQQTARAPSDCRERTRSRARNDHNQKEHTERQEIVRPVRPHGIVKVRNRVVVVPVRKVIRFVGRVGSEPKGKGERKGHDESRNNRSRGHVKTHVLENVNVALVVGFGKRTGSKRRRIMFLQVLLLLLCWLVFLLVLLRTLVIKRALHSGWCMLLWRVGKEVQCEAVGGGIDCCPRHVAVIICIIGVQSATASVVAGTVVVANAIAAVGIVALAATRRGDGRRISR